MTSSLMFPDSRPDDLVPSRSIIEDAARILAAHTRRTPTIHWSGSNGAEAALKLELMQHAGSFKTRGAYANLLLRDVPPGGVAAASGGNHGAAVAFAAHRLGIPATIFVPEISSPAKVERIRAAGAQLIISGQSYADALVACDAWIAARRDDAAGTAVMPVHAYDQFETIVGQATLAAECEEQVPEATTVLVGVGGGALLAGFAAWYDGRVRLIGVEPDTAPSLTAALAAGRPVDVDVDPRGIAADSLGARRLGARAFALVRQRVSRAVLVSDDEIAAAQQYLWESLRVVAEPGGATAFAALLSGRYAPAPAERLLVVLSGGNTSAVQFGSVRAVRKPMNARRTR